MSGRPRLFEWLEMLSLAIAHRKVTQVTQIQAAVGLFVAIGSSGTTGEGAIVDAKRMAAEFSVSERTIWRAFYALHDAGWFERTAAPTRPTADGDARKAEYRMTLPRVDLTLDTGPLRVPTGSGEVAHDAAAEEPYRVPLSAASHDTAERENGSLLRNSPPTVIQASIEPEVVGHEWMPSESTGAALASEAGQ